ncbi:hypothetical protein ACIZ62_13720 [Acetobacterium carbinolicum]|uniref:hypothetical protein n=1 Tax=Acetobacterium carbinolicum TaxID=52690 RepID=UPI0039BF44AF
MLDDIRMNTISLIEAETILKGFEGKWIYVKNICDIGSDVKKQVVLYSKFEIRNVDTFESIRIYGKEDDDRLIIEKEIVKLVQITPENDELMIVTAGENVHSYIYIKIHNPNARNRLQEIIKSEKNIIITEGKTDWKHLKSALERFNANGDYINFDFDFFEYENEIEMGSETLLRVCEYNQLFPNLGKKVFVFDADLSKINKLHEGKSYINHGNNVFSFVLPIPEFRKDTPSISIENYYTDNDIKRVDKNGLRLFMNGEFDFQTGCLIEDENIININYRTHEKMDANYIIDNNIFKVPNANTIDPQEFKEIKKNNQNIALSKNKFANYILEKDPAFSNMNIDYFKEIFDVIEEISKLPNVGIAYTENGILEKTKVQDGVEILKYESGFSVLKLFVTEIDILNGNECILCEVEINDEKVIFTIRDTSYKNSNSLEIIKEDVLINFLREKANNSNNRIELNICYPDKRISIKEILKGEIASATIYKALQNNYSKNKSYQY